MEADTNLQERGLLVCVYNDKRERPAVSWPAIRLVVNSQVDEKMTDYREEGEKKVIIARLVCVYNSSTNFFKQQ